MLIALFLRVLTSFDLEVKLEEKKKKLEEKRKEKKKRYLKNKKRYRRGVRK
jgi:hypothetical protein